MNQQKTFNLSSLSESDIQLILNGLAELPAKMSYNLISNIADQYKKQSMPSSNQSSENKKESTDEDSN